MTCFIISDSCDCPELYVFAAKAVAEKQGAVLGKYINAGFPYNGRPYYIKTSEKNMKYYLHYQLNGIYQYVDKHLSNSNVLNQIDMSLAVFFPNRLDDW